MISIGATTTILQTTSEAVKQIITFVLWCAAIWWTTHRWYDNIRITWEYDIDWYGFLGRQMSTTATASGTIVIVFQWIRKWKWIETGLMVVSSKITCQPCQSIRIDCVVGRTPGVQFEALFHKLYVLGIKFFFQIVDKIAIILGSEFHQLHFVVQFEFFYFCRFVQVWLALDLVECLRATACEKQQFRETTSDFICYMFIIVPPI